MPQQKVSIVTGAGTGIGRAVSRQLSEAGYAIALVGRRREKLEETAKSLAGESMIIPVDLAGPEAAGEVVETVHSEWGRIDALINNAGLAEVVPIPDTTEDFMQRTFAINTLAPARLIAHVWSIMKEQGESNESNKEGALAHGQSVGGSVGGGGGCIVNVSTMGVVDPFPGFFLYAASKAAVESLTRSIYNEGSKLGIKGYSVAPGAVETAMLRASFSEDVLPTSATLNPEDVAAVIVACVLGERPEDEGKSILIPSG